MAGFTTQGPLIAIAVLASGPLLIAPFASADDTAYWDGMYKVTFHVDQKSGTSIAATQQETPYTATYTFKTDCSSGKCVAAVVDGPTPKDNVAQSVAFDWTGSQWTRSEGWKWDCALPDGTITYDQAYSLTNYIPQPDGSLTGTFQTTISTGACQGTVSIPVSAVAA
ncbi:hypothetical protein [Mycolicibacterium komossense]|uniref:Secreted protein n=1 Tax=Mycolicibacterium komossense TaxID=1779 RepID=A0ABT3CIN6_9MYCO|nr:hypothetical protein [Mycolicibacterium komossense]MCV7229409.1 hypothetical protein [Mycolicibacterium komossense]